MDLSSVSKATPTRRNLHLRQLYTIYFLPVGDVPAGLAELKEDIPEGLEPLVDYFDATYITKQLQDRLFNLCQAYYNDDKTLIQTLKGIGHIIRWK